MCVELKVKLKSLAAEQKIIRKEEKKRKGSNWGWQCEKLSIHRRAVVRPVIRSTHIAYGIIRGLDYVQVERHSKTEPNWVSVKTMVFKYGDKEAKDRVVQIIANRSYLQEVA